MARISRHAKLALLLAFTLFVGACSSTTFVYNRLGFILPWYLDDYVELDRQQEEFLDELLEPYLAWHRMEELPLYLDLLNEIEQTIDEPLTSQDMEIIWKDFEQAYLRLEADTLAWLLELGDQLTPEQVVEFLDNLEELQEEYSEKYLERDDEEFADDTYDRTRDTLQEYLGRLNRDQRDRVRTAAVDMHRSDSVWLRERAQWLEQLREMMQREPGWKQEIVSAIETRRNNLPSDYVEVTEHNAAVLYELFADIFNSRTDRQDKHLRKKLDGLKDDLRELIAQGERKNKAA